MFLHARVHKLLYPLIALLLLMQSFAVWHGAEHSFHIEDEQCERFEAFSQAPTLDNIFTISPFYTSTFVILQTNHLDAFISNIKRNAHSIRAPPIFS